MRVFHISEMDFEKQFASLRKFFRPLHSKWFACCTFTIQYSICSTIGQFIAFISDLGEHIYLGASHLSKYDASVGYISYGPSYCTIYISHIVQ